MNLEHQAAKTGRTKFESKSISDEEYRAQFAARFFSAVRNRNAAEVRDLAGIAGAKRWPEAIRPLSDLLSPPSRRWRTPDHKRGWPEARAAAACALGRIHDTTARRALVRALACDPDFLVREAADAAIKGIGTIAVPQLAEAIHMPLDWQLDGMRAVILGVSEPHDLSAEHRRAAGIVLTDVLYANFPQAPTRWTRPAQRIGKAIGIVVMALMIAHSIAGSQWSIPLMLSSLPFAWIAGKVSELCAGAVASFVFSAVRSGAERADLSSAASQSLIRLGNKRTIPGMLQIAFGTPPSSNRGRASDVLCALMPNLNEHDAPIFSPSHVELMNSAVTRPLDPELTSAVLCGLRVAGNGSSIRRVDRVSRKGRTEAIRIQAREVLDVLRARAERARSAQVLLRGSSPPAPEQNILLRAATADCADQPEQLLRAVNGDPS